MGVRVILKAQTATKEDAMMLISSNSATPGLLSNEHLAATPPPSPIVCIFFFLRAHPRGAEGLQSVIGSGAAAAAAARRLTRRPSVAQHYAQTVPCL